MRRKHHLKHSKSSLRNITARTQRLRNLRRTKWKLSERRSLHFFILENS